MGTSVASANIKRRLAAVLLGCFCAITTTVAHAHDAVVGGSPADGEVLASAPTTVTLEFSGEPKQGFNTMAISNSKGDVLVTGGPTVDGRNVTLAIPETTTLTPDEYTIGFQITSSDGHSTRGKTTFTIAGERVASSAASNTATTDAPTDPTAELMAGPWGKVAGGVGILLVLAMIVMILARNRMGKKSQESD